MTHLKNVGFRNRNSLFYIRLLGIALLVTLAPQARAYLSMEMAVELAHQNDPWLAGSEFRQQALEAQSVSASSLPDPMVSFGLANLPTDSFDFNQEAMTQFKLGVSQVLPRGDSREIKQTQLQLMGSQQPLERADRRAQVAVQVSHLWLEAFRARESIRLIEENRDLFEHLVDMAHSNYSSATGRTRQQDLVRAQLELTRLEDRLAVLGEQHETSRARLGEWLEAGYSAGGPAELPRKLPTIPLRNPTLYGEQQPSRSRVAEHLQRHPAILNLDRKVEASQMGVSLAEQKYQPQWKLNAGYGYRDDDPMGNDRADFFSVGVAFDVPLFTSKRQDKDVQSAVATTESLRTDRALTLRRMVASFDSQRARLLRLEERQELYRARLLMEMREQAEASLSAYTNDDGDFSEAVRAQIAELNARIEALGIDIQRLKAIVQLNYFFTADSV